MANVENIVVELDAKVSKYLDKMDKADAANKKTSTSVKELGKKGVKAFATMAVATLAAATALSAYIVNAAKSTRETARLASQAKLTADEFNSLAFATKQYGIDAEKIGDISKDISDRLGEFASAGTGAFQDFLDVTGMTREEGVKLAESYQHLSSDEVIGDLFAKMDKAGASMNDMVFVTESLSGEMSRIIPLFTDNGAELDKLRSRYDNATKALNLTKEEAEALQSTATNFDLMTEQLGKAGNKISATLAPTLSNFFNSVIDVVPAATQTIINFANSFLEASEIVSVQGLESELKRVKGELNDMAEGSITFANVWAAMKGGASPVGQTQALGENIISLIKREKELSTEIENRAEKSRIAAAVVLEGGTISGGSGETADQAAVREKQIADKLAQIEEANLEEIELIQIRADAELEILMNLKASKDEILFAEIELAERVANEKSALLVKQEKQQKSMVKAELKEVKDKEKFKLDQAKGFINAAGILNTALFDDNKAVNAGLIVADTATAIMKSLSINPYDYANVAVLAATGIAQLANNASASRGGGAVSGGSGGGGDVIDGSFDEVPELSSLEVSNTSNDSNGGGINGTTVIRFEAGDGDALLEAIAEGLNNRGRNT